MNWYELKNNEVYKQQLRSRKKLSDEIRTKKVLKERQRSSKEFEVSVDDFFENENINKDY